MRQRLHKCAEADAGLEQTVTLGICGVKFVRHIPRAQAENICTPIPSIGTIDGNMDMDIHGYTVMPAVLSSDCFNLDGCVSLGSYCFGETTRSFLRVAKLVLEKGCILLFLTITQSGERTQLLAMPSTCSIRDQM